MTLNLNCSIHLDKPTGILLSFNVHVQTDYIELEVHRSCISEDEEGDVVGK